MNFFKFIRTIEKYKSEKRKSELSSIKFYNFWKQEISTMWFLRFIHSRKILEKFPELNVSFFATFGSRRIINWDRSQVKIFYTGENVHNASEIRYADHALTKKIDLALGFDYISNERYFRFPFYILSIFPPESNEADIIKKCKELCFQKPSLRSNFAANVSRTDNMGIRAAICNNLSSFIEKVDCAGDFMHNNDDLRMKFYNNKIEYLKNYKFNVCPENSNTKGYVTEKLFNAIEAGCIPIYWGSNNEPEPTVLNQNAILFWNKGEDNSNVLDTIKRLNGSPQLYKEFAEQPRLKPNASEIIIDMFNEFEKRLKDLILSKQA